MHFLRKTIFLKLVRFLETGRIPGKLVGFLENWSDLWKLVGFLENWSDSWKTGQICGTGRIPGKLVGFLENWSDLWKTGQIVELVEVLKTGENAVPVHKSWPEEGGNGREDEKKAKLARGLRALSKH